jgi:hypothetical protein
VLVRQHADRRLLRHQKAAEPADRDRLGDIGGHEVDERAARPSAGVVNHQIRYRDLALHQPEQALDFVGVGGVAGKGAGAGLGTERAEFFDSACRQRDADTLFGEQPRQRRAEAFAGADDQGGLKDRRFHKRCP